METSSYEVKVLEMSLDERKSGDTCVDLRAGWQNLVLRSSD